MLLVRGNIIYLGEAYKSIEYFEAIGFPCPPFTNPADFYMRITNMEDVMLEYNQRNEQISKEQAINIFAKRVSYMSKKHIENY